MGVISTYLIARFAAKRVVRQQQASLRAARKIWPCSRCGQPLILSIDWPKIDPHWWEDRLNGVCSDCNVPLPPPRPQA